MKSVQLQLNELLWVNRSGDGDENMMNEYKFEQVSKESRKKNGERERS